MEKMKITYKHVEEAKLQLLSALNQIIQTYPLPACIYEGIIQEMLAEIRQQGKFELIEEFKQASKPLEPKKEESQ